MRKPKTQNPNCHTLFNLLGSGKLSIEMTDSYVEKLQQSHDLQDLDVQVLLGQAVLKNEVYVIPKIVGLIKNGVCWEECSKMGSILRCNEETSRTLKDALLELLRHKNFDLTAMLLTPSNLLDRCCLDNDLETLRLLLSKVKLSLFNAKSLLNAACLGGHTEIVAFFVNYGLPICCFDEALQLVFFKSAHSENKKIEIATILLQAGASILLQEENPHFWKFLLDYCEFDHRLLIGSRCLYAKWENSVESDNFQALLSRRLREFIKFSPRKIEALEILITHPRATLQERAFSVLLKKAGDDLLPESHTLSNELEVIRMSRKLEERLRLMQEISLLMSQEFEAPREKAVVLLVPLTASCLTSMSVGLFSGFLYSGAALGFTILAVGATLLTRMTPDDPSICQWECWPKTRAVLEEMLALLSKETLPEEQKLCQELKFFLNQADPHYKALDQIVKKFQNYYAKVHEDFNYGRVALPKLLPFAGLWATFKKPQTEEDVEAGDGDSQVRGLEAKKNQ